MTQRPSKHYTIWTSHIKDPRSKQAFLDSLSNQVDSPQWKRFQQILNDKIATIETTKLNDYGNPAWAYQQADYIGYTRALKEILDLIPTTKI